MLAVAAGVFAMLRLAGWLIFERLQGRKRHTARGAHMGTGIFLLAAAFSFLRQTAWLVELWQWMVTTTGSL